MPGRADLQAALAYAQAQQHDDPPRSLAVFEYVAQHAAIAGDKVLAAEAWLGCGESVGLIDGRERESPPYLRQAAELAPETTVAALSWLSAGEMLRFCGELSQSAEAYTQALTVFEGLGDHWGECLGRKALADLLMSQSRAEEAVPHVVRATYLALKTDEPEMAAELQLALGEQLSELKHRSEAVSPLRAAAELARMVGNARLEARARGALLNAIHFAQPDAGAAQRAKMVWLIELSAANAVPEDSEEAGRAAEFMLAALTGGQQGRTDRASAMAERVISEGRARLELATQLLALGRGEPSFGQYLRAAELFQQAEEKQWAGRALLGCAGAHLADDQAQESPTWFSRAAEQFEECGDDAGLVQALAGRLQALSELQRWDELGTSRRVVTLTDRDKSPPARAARMIAFTYQVQALTAADDLAGATDVAAGAADLAHELGEDELEARLRLGMAHSLHVLERYPSIQASRRHCSGPHPRCGFYWLNRRRYRHLGPGTHPLRRPNGREIAATRRAPASPPR